MTSRDGVLIRPQKIIQKVIKKLLKIKTFINQTLQIYIACILFLWIREEIESSMCDLELIFKFFLKKRIIENFFAAQRTRKENEEHH